MVQNHLSRLATPRTWPISRKDTKWITRTMPGPHSLAQSIPLSVLIRDILGYARTMKEIKLILNNKSILVDKESRNEHKYPVGLMDVIDLPDLDEHYRVIYTKRGLFSLKVISAKESDIKLLKIVRKAIVRNNAIQVTFHDGRSILLGDLSANVGDSVLFNFSSKKVLKIIPLETESLVYLSGGLHIGEFGIVKNIIRAKDLQKPKVVVGIRGKDYTTLAEYVFVVGKNKPEIDLEEKQ